MDIFKQQIIQLEQGKKNIEWRRIFNRALRGGGLKELAENQPELFLKVLEFIENGEIIPLVWVNLCKDVIWNALLKSKFPHDFQTDEDIVTKYEWLNDKPPQEDIIQRHFTNPQETDPRVLQLRNKALKCFYYWTKGWSKVLQGHTNSVMSVCRLNETTIVSGSLDRTLRVWDLTNDTSRVLRGHTASVRSVVKLNETTIVSGSRDRTLRVWDLTNNTSRVLNGHTESVRSVMKLNDTTIVSGSLDRTLRIWDLTNNTSRVLNGHTDGVYSVMKLNETTIVSGSWDDRLRVWDLADMNNITSRVKNQDHILAMIKLNETTIVSGRRANLRIWDLTDNDTSFLYTNGHTDDVNSVMKLNETTIVSGSDDNTLRVWDLTDMGNVTSRVLRGHTHWVYSVVKLNDTTIVSGSRDNTLRVWYGVR